MNRELLSPVSIEYIRTLAPASAIDQCLLVHGFPPESTTTYLFEVSDIQLKRVLSSLEQELCFVGHTHDLELIAYDGRGIRHMSLAEGEFFLHEGWKYLVNAGSVGQPRDGDNHAKYLIWDTQSRHLTVRFLRYDIARTVAKILALGLPRINADRLW